MYVVTEINIKEFELLYNVQQNYCTLYLFLISLSLSKFHLQLFKRIIFQIKLRVTVSRENGLQGHHGTFFSHMII